MSFVTRLVDWVRETAGSALDPAESLDVSDDKLAAAALLVHVARVDGRFGDSERQALLGLLGSSYGLSPGAAEALATRADRFDLEVDDVAALVEMLGHERHGQDRERLLSMAFGVAAADGAVIEFEDDLLWRLGRLLGFDDDAIARVRSEAVTPSGAA